jgi:hypothetical protein
VKLYKQSTFRNQFPTSSVLYCQLNDHPSLTDFKCNGLKPCQTCTKRSLSCTYGSPDHDHEEQPSPKRRMVDPPKGTVSELDDHSSPVMRQAVHWVPKNHIPTPNGTGEANISSLPAPGQAAVPFPDAQEQKPAVDVAAGESALVSQGSTVSGPDEEAVVYSNSRMLQDPTGRLRSFFLSISDYLLTLNSLHRRFSNPVIPAADSHDCRQCGRTFHLYE